MIEYGGPAGQKRRIQLRGNPLTIGRDPSNVLSFNDERMSRFHCVVERDGEAFCVRDLKSRNGIRVNNRRVESRMLVSGDTLIVGRMKMHFVVEPSRGKPAVSAPRERSSSTDTPASDFNWEALEPSSDQISPNRVEPGPDRSVRSIRSVAQLQDFIDTFAEGDFNEDAIALLNARDETVHASVAVKESADTADSVVLLRHLILLCFRTRATDLHIEPKSGPFHVRIRVDGMMVNVPALDSTLGERVLRVVKILADIDIAQVNTVQEGHFSAHASGRRVDYRVSYTPSMYGQKMVLRVLDLDNAPRNLEQMHLPRSINAGLCQVAKRDTGMILTCGPTGSGKTTTLYALLRAIDLSLRNVITIEEPVEYQLEGVTQLPVNDAQGNSFSSLLRSSLRQDPDVILVGEIRDPETASIAMQAAMTGHLVFSTVHARDAMGTIFRLMNLGIEPYMVATGLNLVLAQRLVRQLCVRCRKPTEPSEAFCQYLATSGLKSEGHVYEPGGCPHCLDTGFKGRRALFEMITVNDEIQDAILSSSQIQEVRKAVGQTQFRNLRDNGYAMVAQGITSLEEIDRTAGTM